MLDSRGLRPLQKIVCIVLQVGNNKVLLHDPLGHNVMHRDTLAYATEGPIKIRMTRAIEGAVDFVRHWSSLLCFHLDSEPISKPPASVFGFLSLPRISLYSA